MTALEQDALPTIQDWPLCVIHKEVTQELRLPTHTSSCTLHYNPSRTRETPVKSSDNFYVNCIKDTQIAERFRDLFFSLWLDSWKNICPPGKELYDPVWYCWPTHTYRSEFLKEEKESSSHPGQTTERILCSFFFTIILQTSLTVFPPPHPPGGLG